MELFSPVQQADYVGYAGGGVGPKGLDEAMLAGYEIVDDPRGAKNVTPTVDDDGEVCLHTDVEPYEDEPTRGACAECGEELDFPGERESEDEGEAEEPAGEDDWTHAAKRGPAFQEQFGTDVVSAAVEKFLSRS